MPVFYFGPVSWYAEFLNQEDEIILEQWENFPKQTYRNRTNIYGANGKLSLIIPIHHNGKRLYRETEISYRENWKKLHWKSIKTAYQSSPYFEFYEDRLEKIFQNEEKNLFDYNLFVLKTVLDILKTEKAYSLNSEYSKAPNMKDFREKFSAKTESEYKMDEYYQIFSDRYRFMKDLSILDLLCNKGPESLTYIKSVANKN